MAKVAVFFVLAFLAITCYLYVLSPEQRVFFKEWARRFGAVTVMVLALIGTLLYMALNLNVQIV